MRQQQQQQQQPIDPDEEADRNDPILQLLLKLATFSSRWCVILRFRSQEDSSLLNQYHFPADAFVDLHRQGRLNKATLVCGLNTSTKPKHMVPGPFFRTLDCLLDMMRAGRAYASVKDTDLGRGLPRPGWCKLPIFSAAPATEEGKEEAEAASAVPERLLVGGGHVAGACGTLGSRV